MNTEFHNELCRRFYSGMTFDSSFIMDIVCREFCVTQSELESPSRLHRLVIARLAFAYVSRNHTNLSLDEIGRKMGGRDHSTIHHLIKNYVTSSKIDALLRIKVERCICMVKGQKIPEHLNIPETESTPKMRRAFNSKEPPVMPEPIPSPNHSPVIIEMPIDRSLNSNGYSYRSIHTQ